MEKPLVSIIMGCYNAERTISRCIDSICNQTYLNWEFIICDDGSKDKTREILENYSKRDQRIFVIKNNTNGGLAAGLNRCLDMAKGKYIARMDDDDISLPTRLEKEVAYLEHHSDIDIVGTSMVVFSSQGELGVRQKDEKVTRNSFLKGSPFSHPTIMVRTDALRAVNGYNLNVGRTEDLDLWFRLYKEGYKGSNLTEPLYKYHESFDDYKKRTLQNGCVATRVFLRGYRELKLPVWQRWRAFRPIVSALLPNKLMLKFHYLKLNKELGPQ